MLLVYTLVDACVYRCTEVQAEARVPVSYCHLARSGGCVESSVSAAGSVRQLNIEHAPILLSCLQQPCTYCRAAL